ncbi:MAG TPA: division/cell wall cluster transcriptional repressor MraZ [Actinomycetota bacterium]|nr:division/cell wall cluster transcriptional repressor MraZ [Actinomycetota bacterium]
MLLGEFRHSLDTKGRVFLPSRWREELGEVVVITKGFEGCLFLMGKTRFEEFAQRFDDLPVERKDARAYSRFFFSKASEEQVDGQGRITIPANLRELAGLGKELVLAGVSRRAEIWDRTLYDSYQSNVVERYEEIAETLQF